MSVIIIGLQYETATNFYDLFVKGISFDSKDRKSLREELVLRYRELLLKAEESSELRLRTSTKKLQLDMVFTPVVMPSANERFKNVFLFGQLNDRKGKEIATTTSNTKQQSCQFLNQSVSDLLKNSTFAKRKAQETLGKLVSTNVEIVPKLLLLGAVLFDHLVDCTDCGQSTVGTASIEQTRKKTNQKSNLLEQESKSFLGRTIARFRRRKNSS